MRTLDGTGPYLYKEFIETLGTEEGSRAWESARIVQASCLSPGGPRVIN